jgi:hypothetical protein
VQNEVQWRGFLIKWCFWFTWSKVRLRISDLGFLVHLVESKIGEDRRQYASDGRIASVSMLKLERCKDVVGRPVHCENEDFVNLDLDSSHCP